MQGDSLRGVGSHIIKLKKKKPKNPNKQKYNNPEVKEINLSLFSL